MCGEFRKSVKKKNIYIYTYKLIQPGRRDGKKKFSHVDNYRKNGLHGVIHQCPVQGLTRCVWPNPSQSNGRIVVNGGASWSYVVRVKNLHSHETIFSNVFAIQCLNAIGKSIG